VHLTSLSILNYKNIADANLVLADKINCFIGLNGMGKTNVLDAIYYLSFTKSAFSSVDSQNINHEAQMALIKGVYTLESSDEPLTVSCGLRRGVKKQFRLGSTDYKRLIDHIGLLPLVMVSPEDSELIAEGSDERRRFLDVVISQYDRHYLEQLTTYNQLLRQRNQLLRRLADEERQNIPADSLTLFEVIEQQMLPCANYIYQQRTDFIERFIPFFQDIYQTISGQQEQVTLGYHSQLQDRNLQEAFIRTRPRDLILGWTSQGIHKDDLDMLLDNYPLKRVGSQGQQKTYLLALKLAQALFLSQPRQHATAVKPILLLDDIFDKLDACRVEKIVGLLSSDRFGQIFITDTDRQHLQDILSALPEQSYSIFHVSDGAISIQAHTTRTN